MIPDENMEVLKKIKENLDNAIPDMKFDFNQEDDIHEFMAKTHELVENYKKDHGNEIITDKNGNSCYVKDLKITQSYEEGKMFHCTLEGHSKEFDRVIFDIKVNK